MTNAYCSLEQFKAAGVQAGNPTIPAEDDVALLALLEAISRELDSWAGRFFYSLTAAKVFSASDRLETWIPEDLIAVTTLKEDTNWDGVYETTWASTDYNLWPFNANPTASIDRARPYRQLQTNLRSNGSSKAFIPGSLRYELTGKWGYSESTEDVTTLDESSDITATITTMGVVGEDLISVGDTLVLGTEQMYVTNKQGGDLTVERGVNGTTAAIHLDGVTISRIKYPPAIVQGVKMQAGRIWTRRISGFSQEIGFDSSGQFMSVAGVDRDVKQLTAPYKLRVV